jgi:hypothetical protein
MWGVSGKKTHNVGMIEALEDPHLAPDALLIPFDLLFRDSLQRDFASDVLHQPVGGVSPARKLEGTMGSCG